MPDRSAAQPCLYRRCLKKGATFIFSITFIHLLLHREDSKTLVSAEQFKLFSLLHSETDRAKNWIFFTHVVGSTTT